MKCKKVWIYVIGVIIACLTVMSILYDIKHNHNAVAMITGLWSAGATAVLGGIAFWQNKQYKKLADKSSEDTKKVQDEIRDLTYETKKAIETLKRIEVAKYCPILRELPEHFFGLSREMLKEFYENRNCASQYSCINIAPQLTTENFLILIEKYYTVSFVLKNDGEKEIRNFNCKGLLIDGESPPTLVFYACDVSSGQDIVVSLINLPIVEEANTICIKMTFEMDNFLAEKFHCEIEYMVFMGESPSAHITSFSHPVLIDGGSTIRSD